MFHFNKEKELLSKEKFIKVMKDRFEANINRHENLEWEYIEDRLNNNEDKILILLKMEEFGGEPDVVSLNEDGSLLFMDCVKECPRQRKSLCYDELALSERKLNKPGSSVEKMVQEIGSELINEEDYLFLQRKGDFDLKTSSWLKTPIEIRERKGAIFGDKRFGRTFIYHNGAESYYSSRGFRTKLTV